MSTKIYDEPIHIVSVKTIDIPSLIPVTHPILVRYYVENFDPSSLYVPDEVFEAMRCNPSRDHMIRAHKAAQAILTEDEPEPVEVEEEVYESSF